MLIKSWCLCYTSVLVKIMGDSVRVLLQYLETLRNASQHLCKITILVDLIHRRAVWSFYIKKPNPHPRASCMRGRRSIPWDSIIFVKVNNNIINKISWLRTGIVVWSLFKEKPLPVFESLQCHLFIFIFFAIVSNQLIKIILHIFISLYAIYIFISCYAIVIVQLIKITPSIAWRNALPIYSSLKYLYPHVTLTLYTPTDQTRRESVGWVVVVLRVLV